MKIVIDIPLEWLFDMKNKKFCQTDSLYQKLLNGTPLPKGHGRLIDADALADSYDRCCVTDCSCCSRYYSTLGGVVSCGLIDDAPTIIEADKAENKEYGVKVINRGNCMLCGKKLTEGLLFCKECEAKGK